MPVRIHYSTLDSEEPDCEPSFRIYIPEEGFLYHPFSVADYNYMLADVLDMGFDLKLNPLEQVSYDELITELHRRDGDIKSIRDIISAIGSAQDLIDEATKNTQTFGVDLEDEEFVCLSSLSMYCDEAIESLRYHKTQAICLECHSCITPCGVVNKPVCLEEKSDPDNYTFISDIKKCPLGKWELDEDDNPVGDDA